MAYFRGLSGLNHIIMRSVSHLLSGLIIGVLVALYTLVIAFAGQMGNKTLGFSALLIMVGGVAFFVWRHAKASEELLSFGKLFSYGFKATAVMTLVQIGYAVLFYNIFPEYREVLFDVSRAQMMAQGGVSEEQAEAGLAMMRNFFWPMIISGSLFNAMMAGAVGSLIGAGVTAKKRSHKG